VLQEEVLEPELHLFGGKEPVEIAVEDCGFDPGRLIEDLVGQEVAIREDGDERGNEDWVGGDAGEGLRLRGSKVGEGLEGGIGIGALTNEGEEAAADIIGELRREGFEVDAGALAFAEGGQFERAMHRGSDDWILT